MRLSGSSILKFFQHDYPVRVCVCVCARVGTWVLSCVWLFVTPWTVTWESPLSMGFSRQEDWSGDHCFLQWVFLTQGLNPVSWFHALPGSRLHCTAWETPVTFLWECIKHFLEAFGLWTLIVFVQGNVSEHSCWAKGYENAVRPVVLDFGCESESLFRH